MTAKLLPLCDADTRCRVRQLESVVGAPHSFPQPSSKPSTGRQGHSNLQGSCEPDGRLVAQTRPGRPIRPAAAANAQCHPSICTCHTCTVSKVSGCCLTANLLVEALLGQSPVHCTHVLLNQRSGLSHGHCMAVGARSSSDVSYRPPFGVIVPCGY